MTLVDRLEEFDRGEFGKLKDKSYVPQQVFVSNFLSFLFGLENQVFKLLAENGSFYIGKYLEQIFKLICLVVDRIFGHFRDVVQLEVKELVAQLETQLKQQEIKYT